MENNENNIMQDRENIPAPPTAYEQAMSGEGGTASVAAEVSVQPVGVPAESPAAPAAFVPAVHAITPVDPRVEIKRSGKGLTAFIILVLVAILLVVSAGAGFIFGREYGNKKHNNPQLVSKPADSNAYTVESVYNIVSQSVVKIAVYAEGASSVGYASGVIYSEDGYIITNDHIYEKIPNAKFIVITNDGKKYDAAFVAGDTRSDLAVLKINATGLKPAVFGNSDETVVGEAVVAVGHPDGVNKSVATTGIVSAANIWESGNTSYSTRLIQTDAALNPGSSGGALANAYGQVIGITSSKIIAMDTDLVNYAIPTSVMKRVADSLIEHGYVVGRSMLGITYNEIDSVVAEISGYPSGLYIQSIAEDSGLYGKGLEKGDIITHMNGVEITDASVMLEELENTKAGTQITLQVYTTDGKSVAVSAKLKEYVGTSSYKKEAAKEEGGDFDFPLGE